MGTVESNLNHAMRNSFLLANSSRVDQPAHQRRLICTDVIRYMQRVLAELHKSEFVIF